MDADPPIAPVAAVAAWLAELAQVPTGLVGAYLPGLGVNARTREQLILVVTETNGCRWSAWVHESWLAFLGDREPDDALGPLFDYARACAAGGRPLDATTLEAVYPAGVVRSVRATVARAQIGNLADTSAEGIVETLRGRRPWSVGRLARDAVHVAAGLPFTVPAVAAAAAMRAVDRLAPSMPDVHTPSPAAPDANLVVDLLAHAVPAYLGNTILRTGLVWAPVSLSIAFRMEGNAATLTVGRGAVRVEGGVSPHALVVVDGGLDSLLRVVADRITGELTNPRALRHN